MSGAHRTVHSILPLRHLSSLAAAASFTAAMGKEHRRVPTLSGGLERVKWSRDRVVYFTLVTIHWVAASPGPVGLCGCIPAGPFWVTSRDNKLGSRGHWWKTSKSRRFSTSLSLSCLASFWKDDSPHSWEKLHLPSELRANPDPPSHNTSDTCSAKERPLTASGPLARREITFKCHNLDLPPYSRVWYITSLSEWGNDLLSPLQLSLIRGLVIQSIPAVGVCVCEHEGYKLSLWKT